MQMLRQGLTAPKREERVKLIRGGIASEMERGVGLTRRRLLLHWVQLAYCTVPWVNRGHGRWMQIEEASCT